MPGIGHIRVTVERDMKFLNTLSADPPKQITDLRHLVYSSAEKFKDKPLYLYIEDGVEKKFTYTDLARDMDYLGTAFYALGIGGARVAVIGETHPKWITTYYATVNGGGVIVPLDRELKIESIIGFCCEAEVSAICYTGTFNKTLVGVRDKLPTVKYFIPIHPDGEEKLDCVRPYDELLELGRNEIESGNKAFLSHKIDMNAMCAIIFTSGTTGASKGVMLSQHNLTASVNAASRATKFDSKSTFVSVLPPHHTYEMTCGHLAMANIGGTVFINDSLKHTLRNFQKYAPNSLILVPLFLETMHKKIWDEIRKKNLTAKVRAAMRFSDMLLRIGIDRRREFFKSILDAFGGNLQCIICGGAPISSHIIRDFYSFGIMVLEGYGITECSPLVSVNRADGVRLRSVGKPVDNCYVKIAKSQDSDDGTGEILVKGDNVMLGYYKNEKATAAAFTEDGWFRTGDVGYMDKDGYIYITGRLKNVIILSNGKNIYPEEIEEYLKPYPEIKECVVIGAPNDQGEVVITAVVYPDRDLFPGQTDDEILLAIKKIVNSVNKQLPSFKHIVNVRLRSEEFEKNTSRKILRFKVKG